MLEHSGEVSLRFLSGDDAQGGGAYVATKDVVHWMSERPMRGCDVWRMDPSTSRFSGPTITRAFFPPRTGQIDFRGGWKMVPSCLHYEIAGSLQLIMV